MWVLLIYVGLMITGDLVDYGIGSVAASLWGDSVSLIVFLSCYFFTLWLAWAIAWRLAERLRLTT